MTKSQLQRRIRHVAKLQRFAQRKRRPARVRHYQRIIDALYLDLAIAQGPDRWEAALECADAILHA